MSDLGAALAVALVLSALVAGGCVASTSGLPAPAAVGAPATEGPSNFAAPVDLLQRYPTMRRQQL
jgi:hypothetical protein